MVQGVESIGRICEEYGLTLLGGEGCSHSMHRSFNPGNLSTTQLEAPSCILNIIFHDRKDSFGYNQSGGVAYANGTDSGVLVSGDEKRGQ